MARANASTSDSLDGICALSHQQAGRPISGAYLPVNDMCNYIISRNSCSVSLAITYDPTCDRCVTSLLDNLWVLSEYQMKHLPNVLVLESEIDPCEWLRGLGECGWVRRVLTDSNSD